jgi:hypothetical protein
MILEIRRDCKYSAVRLMLVAKKSSYLGVNFQQIPAVDSSAIFSDFFWLSMNTFRSHWIVLNPTKPLNLNIITLES